MNVLKTLENLYVAITFAEAGEFYTARQIVEEQKTKEKQERKTLRTRRILRDHQRYGR